MRTIPRERPPRRIRASPRSPLASRSRLSRTRYLAAVANVDRDLGLVHKAVRERLGKDAMFVFTSDHGAQFPFGKWNCYDAGVRTRAPTTAGRT